ncbi:hypothetical protein EC973_000072 [Apophysomyces ossiformis]|uniref:C2H2-type domain-containing protein n=1 Tax=Apophysomyces ossiformis TaxID=679940 RepID=A0A8H7BZE2_9FUNG|nr:hypothetical protein EC973_000072 [Apophysomyces ossiformis]
METESMTTYDQPSNTTTVSEKLPSINLLDERNKISSSASLACESVKHDLIQPDDQENHYAAAVAVTSSFLPPPPSATYAYTAPMTHGFYSQNMSPPLTPAVSPSSILLDSMQFKRKFSVDVGPFSFGSGMPHPPSINDQDAFRRSSCSAMSMDACMHEQQASQHHPYSAAAAAMAAAAAATRCPDYSFFTPADPTTPPAVNPFAASTVQHQPQSKASTKRHSRSLGGQQSQAPTTQHKHVCKYAFCGWSFKRYEHLKRHMLVHTGERPHVCTFPGCGKSFSRSDNFHAHYRTHTKKSMSQQNTNRRLSHQQQQRQQQQQQTNTSSVMDTPISTGSMHSPASQVFEQDRTPATYFANARQASFDMTPYSDIYDQRQTYSPEDNGSYDSQQQQQAWRSFGSPVAPSSPSGTPSLLNHESQSPNPFFSSLPNDRSPMTYAMQSMTPTSLANSAMAAVACYGPFAGMDTSGVPTTTTATTTTPTSALPSPNSRRSSEGSTGSSSNQQKSHVCPVTQCQRRFKRLEHLKRHMRIHTLERPFACTFPNCLKTFSRSDNLSQHMKTHQRVEDRRRRQQQNGFKQPQQHLPPLHHHQNTNSMAVAAAAAAAVNMGMNWHVNTGTVV